MSNPSKAGALSAFGVLLLIGILWRSFWIMIALGFLHGSGFTSVPAIGFGDSVVASLLWAVLQTQFKNGQGN